MAGIEPGPLGSLERALPLHHWNNLSGTVKLFQYLLAPFCQILDLPIQFPAFLAIPSLSPDPRGETTHPGKVSSKVNGATPVVDDDGDRDPSRPPFTSRHGQGQGQRPKVGKGDSYPPPCPAHRGDVMSRDS